MRRQTSSLLRGAAAGSAQVFLQLLFLALFLGFVSADIYMKYPRASNNRLDEPGRERANANRLFDSQNNERGGVNVGNEYYYPGSRLYIEWTNQHSCGGPNNNCELIIQYACDSRIRDGTTTTTIPTNQAQCSGFDCDTDVRYGRHESWESYRNCLQRKRNEELFTSNQRLNGQSARFTRQNPGGTRRGLECPEERDYYPYWHPTMWRDVAILTNQPGRCASYMATSQNVQGRWYCELPAGLVASKGNREAFIPITQRECEEESWWNEDSDSWEYGRWRYVSSWGLPPPLCREAPWTRDNHLGNIAASSSSLGVRHAEPATYNWTLPDLAAFHPHFALYGDSVLSQWASYAAEHGSADAARHFAESSSWNEFAENRNCVLRMRYNVSTNDFEHFAANTRQGREAKTSERSAEAIAQLSSNINRANSTLNKNANRDPALVDVWSRFRLTHDDVADSFDSQLNGNPSTLRNSREYVLKNNPQVNIFGDLFSSLRVSAAVKLQLAINTAQYGRTFQDRSHSFKVLPLPSHIAEQRSRPEESDESVAERIANEMRHAMLRANRGNTNGNNNNPVIPRVDHDFAPVTMHDLASRQGLPLIHNVNVRGKRGNIVQTFPSEEYDFTPPELHMTQGQWIHFQWAGSNTNSRENAGQGLKGTDRSNVVAIRPAVFLEGRSAAGGGAAPHIDGTQLLSQRSSLYPQVPGATQFLSTKGQWGRSFPDQNIGGFGPSVERGVKAAGWRFLGLDYKDLRALATGDNGQGASGETSELDDASTYFDLGPRQVHAQGVFHYLCTRNNNFSNRGQKGKIVVSQTTMDVQPVGINGGTLHAQGVRLTIPWRSLNSLHHITLSSTPAQAVHGSSLKPHNWASSNYVYVDPLELDTRAPLRLHLDHQQPWYALGVATVYTAPGVSGPWREVSATESNGVATTNTNAGGVFVVVSEPHVGGLVGIALAIVLLIGGAFWCYRRRKRGQPLLPGGSDPLNQKV